MSYGQSPKNASLLTQGKLKRLVPGLRDYAPPSDCEIYKIENGKKVLVRIERVE